jgi:uncharacterized repeat protein (TIGR01451 family)
LLLAFASASAQPFSPGCSIDPFPPSPFVPISTLLSITDVTTGNPVADPALMQNLQSAIAMHADPDGSPSHIEIDLPYGCYHVEFLFSEIVDCITPSNQRSFLVDAPQLGVTGAAVNIYQQTGGPYRYYPAAYTAAGAILDGALKITFTPLTLNPIVSGFVITPLVNCAIPPAPPGSPTPAALTIDLGNGQPLPPGVRISYDGRPALSKRFDASTIPVNGTSVLTFTITNPNTYLAADGVAFTDTLPSGLTVPDGSAAGCGGTVTATGSNTIALAGGSIAAGGSCEFTATVTGSTAGEKNNTTGVLSSTTFGAGATSNTATITVLLPPAIGKAFGAGSAAPNASTSLTFTLSNPNGTVALTGIAFTDTLPPGLQIAATPGAASTCGGTFAPNAGDTTLTFSGGSIAPGGTCTVAVNVTATTAGVKDNTTAAVTSTNGGTGNTGSASLTVGTAELSITKNHTGELRQGLVGAQFTIGVRNEGTLPTDGSAVTVIDNLPVGLTATSIGGPGWSCTLATLVCTRSDVLAAGSSYPDITLIVNVGSDAPASVTNTAGVSGGGDPSTGHTASDSAAVALPIPALSPAALVLLALALAIVGAAARWSWR